MIQDIANYAGQLFGKLKERADWVETNSNSLGQSIACIMILQLLIRAGQIYDDIKYMLTMLMMTGGIRAIARTYMIEADKNLIQALIDNGLIPSDRGQAAITVLDNEATKISERWAQFKQEFTNALSGVDTSYNDAVSYILSKYQTLGCKETFLV